jgi:hypothetical protein
VRRKFHRRATAVSRSGGVLSGRGALRAVRRPQHCGDCRLAASELELVMMAHLALADAAANEHAHQVAFVTWCDWMAGRAHAPVPELGERFAVGNGGLRHVSVGKALQIEGVTAGVPDWLLFVPAPALPFVGLAIEFKRPIESGHGLRSVSAEQRVWLKRFERRGLMANVAFGVVPAMTLTSWYFGLDGLELAVDDGRTLLDRPLAPVRLWGQCAVELFEHDRIRLWRTVYTAPLRTGNAGAPGVACPQEEQHP